MNLVEWKEHVSKHDYWYNMTDDHRVWSKGNLSWNKLVEGLNSFEGKEREEAEAYLDKAEEYWTNKTKIAPWSK
jgi:hypothetical protein